MTDENRRLVQTLVGVYGFYGAELTEYAIRVWSEDLRGVPLADVEAAFTRHRRDTERGRWLPKPADIIRQLTGDTAEQALVQWGHVLAAARRGGGFGAEHTDAARQAVQSMGGWGAICRAKEEDNAFLQRRFVDAFAAFKRRDEAAPWIGVAEVRRIKGAS